MGQRQGALESLVMKPAAPRPETEKPVVALARWVSRLPLGRFLVVGGGNTLLYAVLSYFLMHALTLPAEVSATIAYLAALPVAFLAHKKLVFRVDGAVDRNEIARFLTTHGINIVLGYGVVAVVCGALGLSREIGILASCATFSIVSLVLMKMWVFKAGT